MSDNMPGSGARAMEQGADLKGAFSGLLKYVGALKWGICAAVILSLAGAVFNLIGPSKIGDMTDIITQGLTGDFDISAVVSIAWLLVFLYLAGFVVNYVQGFIMATVAQRITQSMRRDISEKIDQLPLRYLDSTPSGDVLSRITNDVDTVGQTMNQSLSTLVSSLAMLVGALAMMAITNLTMTVAGVVATLVGVLLTTVVIKKSQPNFNQQQVELGKINGHVDEVFSSLDVVKVFNAKQQVGTTFHKMNDSLYQVAWKSTFLSSLMMPLMTFIGNLAYVVVCVVGAVLAMQGSISFGVIVAFMIYIRLFTEPIQNLSQAATSVQSMAAACTRVFEFLGQEEMEDESQKTDHLDEVEGRVTFEEVRFGYDPDNEIIHGFSAAADPGAKVAIVGPTGAGKTTIVNLLMRFYEVDSGRIAVDGMPTCEITRENVHKLFGMVLQDTWLFEGTLRENLVFDTPGVDDSDLDGVCKACGLSDLVARLPQGYDTTLASENLSAGQRQLITIARAMVEDAPLLILDEATSSVDTRTEQKVQHAMDTLMSGRTSFVIAHRLSTIKNADLILVMENGDIVEKGTHTELIAKAGAYARLYNSQFEQAG